MLIFNMTGYLILAVLFYISDKRKRNWRNMVLQEEKFEHYLSELSTAYGKIQNVNEASAEAEEKYPVTLEENHPYVKIYRAMCEVIEEDGDELSDGYSVFQKNIQHLKEEIRENSLLCRTKIHCFFGLDILAVLPICFLPAVRLWAVSVSGGLSVYYDGNYGLLTTLVLFGCTYLTYQFIIWLLLPLEEQKNFYRIENYLLKKEWMAGLLDFYIQKNYTRCLKKNEQIKRLQGVGNIRAFLMKKVCFFAAGLIGTSVFCLFYVHVGRTQILTQTRLPQYQLMMLSEDERKQADLQFLRLLRSAVKEKEQRTQWTQDRTEWKRLLDILKMKEDVRAEQEIRQLLADSIERYETAGLHWYHAAIIMAAAAAAAEIPELLLASEQWKSRERRMSECLRLQTVVLLLVHYEKTTVEDLLMYMENFAVMFRSQIAEAVDHFSYHRIETLEKMKEEIPDEPMQRICDALQFCEEIPMKEAFLNLEGERAYFLKKNMEERKNYQNESAALAKAAAYVPLFLFIILKMVIPFAAEGLSELSGYSQTMMGF